MKRAGGNLPAVQLELMPGYLEARKMLDRAKTLGEVKGIRDKAQLFRAYAIQARDTAMENRATEIRMWAERRAGRMLIETKARNERASVGRPIGKKVIVDDNDYFQETLKDLYISKDESSQWQKLAAIPEDEFEKRLQLLREIGARFSTNSFLSVAFSSESFEHFTPKDILLAAVDVMGEIDLDPCAEARGARANVPAREHYTKKEDGLRQPWRGRIFMNPPYGNQVELWARKLVAGVESGDVTEAIALLAARTDTQWFQMFGDFPVCFVTGRIKFGGADNGAPFPSAIFYLGTSNRTAFVKRFSEFGPIYARVRESAAANRELENG